jgi:hypothetical protein
MTHSLTRSEHQIADPGAEDRPLLLCGIERADQREGPSFCRQADDGLAGGGLAGALLEAWRQHVVRADDGDVDGQVMSAKLNQPRRCRRIPSRARYCHDRIAHHRLPARPPAAVVLEHFIPVHDGEDFPITSRLSAVDTSDIAAARRQQAPSRRRR